MDGYAIAKGVGDTRSPQIWQEFTEFIPSEIVIAFDYVPFLRHQRPHEQNEYGPLPEVWEESTRQVIAILEHSLSQSLRKLPESPLTQQGSYVPPARYGHGGPIVFPMELLRVVVEEPWLLAVGVNQVSNLVYDAIKAGFQGLREWFKEREVPESEWEFPSVSPYIVRSEVETHARENFPRHQPGNATIIPSSPLNADYPTTDIQFLVLMPYERGAITYFVNNRLHLTTIYRTYAGGFARLRIEGWPGTTWNPQHGS